MKLAAILILLVFSLAACSSDEQELTEPEEVQQENESEEGNPANTTPPQNQNITEIDETNQTPSEEENEDEENRRDERKDDEEPEDKEPEEEEEPEQVPPEEQNETQETEIEPQGTEENDQQEQATSDQIIEVILTPEEMGGLDLLGHDEETLAILGMQENPGYSDNKDLTGYTGYSKRIPLKSLYFAVYTKSEGAYGVVMTIAFDPKEEIEGIHSSYVLDCKNINCATAFLEEIAQIPKEAKSDKHKFLIKGKTVVYIMADSRIGPAWVDNTANSVARRLGMKVANFTEVRRSMKLRNCLIGGNFECTDYALRKKSIELVLKNKIDRDLRIEEIVADSYALKGNCTTGQIGQLIPAGEEYGFEMNLSETPSGCEYDKTSEDRRHFLARSNQDFYIIKIKYRYADNPGKLYVSGLGGILKEKD